MKHLVALITLLTPLVTNAQSWYVSQTFGTNGSVHADPGAEGDAATSHAFRPDGSLLLGGDGYDINTNSYHASFALLDTLCGSLDTSFGTGGLAAVIFEQRTRMWNMALQPDGRIVGCGMIAPNNFGSLQWPGVFRLHADGSIDSTFNGTGYNRLQFNNGTGDFSSCLLNPDGGIICTASGFFSGLGAMRFLADGTLDASYGSGGTAAFPLTNVSSTSRANGLMRPDGSVVAIGLTWSGVNNDYWIALAQFDADGAPDTTFGNGGLQLGPVIVDPSNTPEGGLGASLLPDGRILVSATAPGPDQGFLMACYLPDGTPDSTYATNGVSIVEAGANARGARHELLPDGSTRQYGFIPGGQGAVLARDVNGAVMSNFGDNGVAMANTGITGESFLGGLSTADGRLIGYGGYGGQFCAVRMTTDPTADLLPVISSDGEQLTTTGMGALQWFLDGVELVGANTSTITPAQNGTYTVVMTLSTDCIYTSAPYALLNVGISDAEAGQVRLRGNVITDVLVVDNTVEQARYELFDAHGRSVGSGTLRTGTNVIDVRGLSKGSYALRAVNGSFMGVQRFLVSEGH